MNRRAQLGSGLLEAMASIVVVSVGFLGFAGLQINGLSAANSALFRSKATYLSYQMSDRVRANLPAAEAGAYDALTGQASDPGCAVTSCTSAQMAANDFYEWNNEIATLLPSGSGVVCLTTITDAGSPIDPQCDGAGTLTVKIFWTEKGTPYLFATPFRP